MTPGLRSHKGASCRVAIAECLPEEMQAATREIVSLESLNPRKGHASTLMWSVCAEADHAAITLILQPKGFGDMPADSGRLERFYKGFGFVELQREPAVLLVRQPDLKKRIVQ